MSNSRVRRRQVAYDAAWKQFFALPIMVEHLLRGFASSIAELLDYATLRDVPASGFKTAGVGVAMRLGGLTIETGRIVR